MPSHYSPLISCTITKDLMDLRGSTFTVLVLHIATSVIFISSKSLSIDLYQSYMHKICQWLPLWFGYVLSVFPKAYCNECSVVL
jgi:hypothetical protein